MPKGLVRLLSLLLLQFAITLGCHGAHHSNSANLSDQPETAVRSLYQQVVTRHAVGRSEVADTKTFAPYLSKDLLHRIAAARSCYNQQFMMNSSLKPQLAWGELELFSGDDLRNELRTFEIEQAQPEPDGSVRVDLTIMFGEPEEKLSQPVAAVVRREDGHDVVDDVIYLKSDQRTDEARLSQYLSAGCSQPTDLVQDLYTQVVVHHPHGIPEGAEMKFFAPSLSKALLHRIDLAKACSADWDRENPEPHLKAKMDSTYRLFSGENWGLDPQSFQIERTQSEKDGSMLVYTILTSEEPLERPNTWRVAAVLRNENGKYVIDDVIYVNDSTYDSPDGKPPDQRLSEYLSAGCDGPRWIGFSLPNQPEALIQSLYQQVVAHTPGGIPSGADWKIFAPYMSKTLLHRIDDFDACAAEWSNLPRDPRYPEKAPFGVYESGIFSGGDERTGPRTFQIESTKVEKDDSVRVVVKLSWWDAPIKKIPGDYREYTSADKPMVWHVAPILVRENGRLVVEDVIYLKDENDPQDVERRLSQSLSYECNGPHWAGYGRH
jgi:hypothetical protein